ncbi:MAG TPA: serine/threonine-protein kinase [Polyangiaceae bacterium]|nr:serine/threonine-protein kinase [Polyangiaceae bacterium]
MFPQLFGKYILERELASGGMAVVYLATLRGAGGFEKRLVVKQIRAELASDEAFVRRFVAEAKTTVELSHPNIVPVYELGVEQGVYFIAMELAHGVTLSELLRQDGKLSPEEGAYLGVEICRALDYAHRRSGIVHRDVTPRNVLVDDEGAVRLIDFGIAAPVSVDGSPRERIYGSPGHMPVEQLQGGRLTPATDVFAVGALLVEAWTGMPPFRRATRLESDVALFSERTPLSAVVPALSPLGELMTRAIAERADERPQSAEDLARPLREFLRTADLGDIARRLGERVGHARRASLADASDASDQAAFTPATPPTRSMTPSGSVPPPPVTPSTRPITQPVTETFAFRDEVEEWIRAPSVAPPSANPNDGVVSEGAGTETTPARASRRWIAALALAAGVVTAATLATRRGGPVAPDDVAGRVVAPAPIAVVPSTVVPSIAPPTSSVVQQKLPDVAVTHAPLVHATSSADVPADDVAKGSATLSVTSDLPARVTIDGAPAGTTPLRGVKRAAGRHVVSLVSIELDERLSATVDAKPAASLAVHAEFTRPVPVLRVR